MSILFSERRRGRLRERDLLFFLFLDNLYSVVFLVVSMFVFLGLGLMLGFGKMLMGMFFGILFSLGLVNFMLVGFVGLMLGFLFFLVKVMESEVRKDKFLGSSKESSKLKFLSSL